MPDTVDAVSDTNSNRQDLLDGTVHRDDFVSNGCEMSISGTDVSIASGIAHRTYSGTYYRAYVSRRKFTVPDSAVTAIYYDFSAGEIVADGSTPSEPYLQIGEADTTGGTSTVDDTVAREPTRYGQMGSDLNPTPAHWADEGHFDYQPNSGMSPWANQSMQGQKGLPLPTFERDPSNPKITVSDIDWSASAVSDPNEIHWPSVINTTQVTGAADTFHCYFAPHNSDGIGLASFSDPFGSWSLNSNPVLESGYGEPGAFVRPDGEVWLYSNRPNDDTHLVRSDDGITGWTDDGVAFTGEDVANGGHAGYPRPIQANDGVYVYSFWKPREDHARQHVAYSETGSGNFTHLGVEWLNGQEPSGDVDRLWVQVSLVPYLNGYLAFWCDETLTASNPTGTIRYGWTDNGIHIRDLGVALGSDGSQSWEDSSGGLHVRDPQPFWGNDGNLYLAYAAGQSSNPDFTDAIGIAKADFSEVRA